MNKRKIRIAAIAVSCAGLMACSPVVEFSSERSVMVTHVRRVAQAEAMRLAESECLKYHRHAVLIPDNIRDGKQTFECKD